MVSEERKAFVHRDMMKMSQSFPEFYSKYYNGVYGDEDLQEMTTQPFWQSMRLTKRRLLSKGLHMDLEMQDHVLKKNLRDSCAEVSEDSSNMVGMHRRDVITKRNFTLNERRLRSKKEYEHLNIYMLQGKVEGENATCPNCGHVGKLSEYIDGCDYCGSLFTVKDFETKVSGFSLEENTEHKLKRTMGKTALTLAIITGVLIAMGAVCLGVLMILLMSGNNGLGAIGSMWGFMIAVDLVPVGFRCIWILLFIFLALRILFLHVYGSRIVKEDVAQSAIPNFSGEDFCQNLEYKLRNIHMTDNAAEVAAFASCSLEEIVRKYQDVVDCNVTRCKFIGAYEQDNAYRVRTLVTMRLTTLKKQKIRTKYERIMLVLSGKKDVVNKKEVALREYKCEGCNTSINILEGNTCRYCGAPVDYARYGWVINEYAIEKKPANVHAIASSILISIYVLIFAFHLIYANGDTENDNWLTVYKDFVQAESKFKALYESIPMPDAVDESAKLTDSHYDIISMTNIYEAGDAKVLAVDYLPLLVEDEFTFYGELSSEDKYIFYRKEVIEGDEGYLTVTVTATEDKITVAIDAVSELAELEEKE